MENNIVLIGYRASGKTTYGACLAQKLDYEFLDLDLELESNIQMSIKDLVAAQGMEQFRALETQTLLSLVVGEKKVIATGGGVVLKPENRVALQKLGTIVWLKPPIEEVISYLNQDQTRPRLTDDGRSQTDEILDTWEFRMPLYESLADIIVPLSIFGSIEAETDKIIRALNIQ